MIELLPSVSEVFPGVRVRVRVDIRLIELLPSVSEVISGSLSCFQVFPSASKCFCIWGSSWWVEVLPSVSEVFLGGLCSFQVYLNRFPVA